MTDILSQVIKGYDLREQIGTGGYGTVYRAYQPAIGRDVAIKIIHPAFVNHPDFIRRFEAEAHLVARLEHPHIVPLYDYWRDASGAYLVMRWIRNGSLGAALRRGPWQLEAIMRMLEQIGAALTVAHRRGVIHRDIKPDNVLLDEEGNAYLADFGIAKDLGTSSPADTRAQVIGSPEYLSPEQIEHGPVTPQTDIYSLGILLYEVLTGQVPFPDLPLLALLYKHVHDPVPSVRTNRPDLPAALDEVIQKATAKHPQERYPDVLSLVRDVRRALTWSQVAAQMQQPNGNGSGNGNGNGNGYGSRYNTVRLDELAVLDVAPPPMENPYKGLRAFQEADAADFFGRETLTRRLLARLQEPTAAARFLAVVGPSGSGKSSVVRAGLIPSLRRGSMPGSQRWFVIEMFPGTEPITELAAALMRVAVNPPTDVERQLRGDVNGLKRVVNQILPGAGTELVLVIDQFEELFTRVDDEAARTHLLNSIVAAVEAPDSRLRVIVTLRADFYDRPLMYGGFSDLMRQRTEVVVPLTADELRAAIVQPAEHAGLQLDPNLVEAIIHDVGAQPGMLPLLQYALTELFEKRTGRTLTITPYQDAGGVVGALARRAEETYATLDAPQREAAQQLFLRLVTLGEGTEDTRRRVRRSELAAVAGDARTLNSVIDLYCSYRLLTIDIDPLTREPTVEVAHEALIRTWERLRQWLDASRDDLRLQRRLGTAAQEWVASGRENSFLAAGARLEQFATWSGTTTLALNEVEQEYLTASLAYREARRSREAARQAHELELERRSKRVLRILAIGATAAAIVGILLASTAWAQSTRARAAEARALSGEDAALAAKNDADAQRVVAEDLKVKAEDAWRQSQQDAERARNQSLASGAIEALYLGNAELARALAMLATTRPNHLPTSELALSVAAYEPGVVRVYKGHENTVNRVAFSPDGLHAVSGGKDNAIIYWDLATASIITKIDEAHPNPIKSISFLPDGKRVVAGSEDGMLSLWDVTTKEKLGTFTGHSGEIKGGAISPDGTMYLSASADTTLILWDIATQQQIRTFSGHTQEVHAAAFSPDGTYAVSASQDTTLILWDVATGQQLRSFTGHTGEVRAVAFSADGTRIISGGNDEVLRLWDVASGQQIGPAFVGHGKTIYAVALSPDGKLAVSGADDELIILWDVATAQEVRSFTGHGGYIRDLQFSNDGRSFLSGSVDREMRLWQIDNGAREQLWDWSESFNTAVFSPDGAYAAAGTGDGVLHLFDARTGQVVKSVGGHESGIRSIAFSPDGSLLLTGSDKGDGTLILWRVGPNLELVRVFRGTVDGTNILQFLPDGQRFVSGGGDKQIVLWDINQETPVRSFEFPSGSINGIGVLPSGEQLLVGTSTGLALWNITTGAVDLEFEEAHGAKINSVSVSADGKYALSGAADKLIIVWDVATGKPIWKSDAQTGEVRSVAFAPSGYHALIGTETRMVEWDMSEGVREPVRMFDEHSQEVQSVAWSQDGTHAISAGSDRTVRLWRIDNLAALQQWARDNRFLPELTEAQKETYGLVSQ